LRQILFYTRKRRCERHRKLAENQEEIANDVYNSTFDKACEEMAAKSRIVQCPELVIGSTVYTHFVPNYKSCFDFSRFFVVTNVFLFCISHSVYI